MMNNRWVVFMVAVAIAVSAGGCKKVISKEKVEKLLTDKLATNGTTVKSVDCPADRPIKKGDTFECKVVTDHENVAVTIEQMDDEGSVAVKSVQ